YEQAEAGTPCEADPDDLRCGDEGPVRTAGANREGKLSKATRSEAVRTIVRLRELLTTVAGSRELLIALLAAGVVLRVARWAADRALWGVEAALALNVLGKSYRQLLGPISFTQGAPTGFLLAEKAMVDVFGDS